MYRFNKEQSVMKKALAIIELPLLALAQPAFAGWYYITPPAAGQSFDKTAPLAQWRLVRSFDFANECNDFKSAVPEYTKTDPITEENCGTFTKRDTMLCPRT
jgi:hypothetical protein